MNLKEKEIELATDYVEKLHKILEEFEINLETVFPSDEEFPSESPEFLNFQAYSTLSVIELDNYFQKLCAK